MIIISQFNIFLTYKAIIMNKNIFLTGIIWCIVLSSFAQTATLTEPVTAFKGKVIAREETPFSIDLSFATGDKVVFSFKTVNDKELKTIKVAAHANKTIFYKADMGGYQDFTFYVPYDAVYNFEFVGPKLGSRTVDIEVIRYPASDETRLFSTASTKKIIYDEIELNIDKKFHKTTKVVKDKTTQIELFDKYIYQDIPIRKESFQLKGAFVSGAGRYYHFKLPPPPVKGAQLKYWTYTATSKMGGAKHWEVAKIGVSIGACFINPVAGLAAASYMQFMGPQPGGEPSRFYMTSNETDAKHLVKLTGNIAKKASDLTGDVIVGAFKGKTPYQVLKEESAKLQHTFQGTFRDIHMSNVYGVSNTKYDDYYIFMGNNAPHKAKNVNFEISAIYYAPLYQKVKIVQKEFVPVIETKKVKQKFIRTNIKMVPINQIYN